jgi:hypothetical protein
MNAQNQRQQNILKSHPIPGGGGLAPGRITLREWRPNEEWVTHFFNQLDCGFYYGRYFTDLASALADFEQRVKESLGSFERLGESEPSGPIEIPERILEGINAVRDAQTTDMFNANMVRLQAVALGHIETAQWIEANLETYCSGVFRGFAPL